MIRYDTIWFQFLRQRFDIRRNRSNWSDTFLIPSATIPYLTIWSIRRDTISIPKVMIQCSTVPLSQLRDDTIRYGFFRQRFDVWDYHWIWFDTTRYIFATIRYLTIRKMQYDTMSVLKAKTRRFDNTNDFSPIWYDTVCDTIPYVTMPPKRTRLSRMSDLNT